MADERKVIPKSPRGDARPQDGRGGGRGMPEGLRGNRNIKPCPRGGPGRGEGGGRGQGQGRG